MRLMVGEEVKTVESHSESISGLIDTLLSSYHNLMYIGCYINCMKKLYNLSKLLPCMLSKTMKKQEVRNNLIGLWELFFQGVPSDFVDKEMREFEDAISILHENVNEEEWFVDQQDFIYAQFLTPFHIAAWSGYFEFFLKMFGRFRPTFDAYICSRDLLGNTPLHSSFFCCDKWNTDIDFFISFTRLTNININTPNALGLLPLHICCICNQSRGLEHLVAQELPLDTPVHFICSESLSATLDSIDCIREVCTLHPQVISKRNDAAAEQWQGCGSMEDGCVGSYSLYQSDASYEESYLDSTYMKESAYPCMSDVIQRDDYDCIRELRYALEGMTPLHLAMMSDAPRCALRLLQSVSDLVQSVDNLPSPLQSASLASLALFSYFTSTQSQDLFAVLPKLWNRHGMQVIPSQDLLPITIANGLLCSNFVSVIRILDTHVNINSACFRNSFYAPLHIACVLLNETFIRLLLGYGADVRARTPRGESCIHLVVRSQSFERSAELRSTLVGLLLMAGCDAETVDDYGYTALWYAVRQNDLRCVSMLLGYGSDPAACHGGQYGRNAFHEALRLKNENVVRLIVKKYPEIISIRDQQGWYPFHYVIENGNLQLMVFLLNHTAPMSDNIMRDMERAIDANRATFKHMFSIAPFIWKQINKKSPNENRYHLPFFLPNRTAERCMQCNRKFTLTNVRRHCRRCGQILCSCCCKDDNEQCKDHICMKCRDFSGKDSVTCYFLRQFEDGVKSYFVKKDSRSSKRLE